MLKKIFMIALALLLVVIIAIPLGESNEVYFEKVRSEYTPAPDPTAPPAENMSVNAEGQADWIAVSEPKPVTPPAEASTDDAVPEGFTFADDVSDPDSFEAVTTVEPDVTHAPVMYNALYNGINDKGGVHDVRDCQERLIELGYLSGKADGGYGRNTEKAVAKFQAQNGITETGIADNDTLVLLYSDRARFYDKSMENSGAVTLKKGSKTDEVRKLQQKLIEYGFLGGTADGIYGDDTVEGVKCMEQYYIDKDLAEKANAPAATPEATPDTGFRPAPTPAPLTVTGSVSPDLYERFITDSDIPTVLDHSLKEGDNGTEVRRIQNRLVSLGYMRVGDGDFGQATINALKYFQKLNGFEETGIADVETQTALYSVSAVKSDVMVMPYYIKVNCTEQRVYIYEWDGTGYRKLVQKFICSTGARKTPTPLGVYNEVTGPLERWHYFSEYGSYAQYAWNIIDGVFFHSILYNRKNDSRSIQYGTVENLGRPASHGCVRLRVDDAKWIYENCPAGCTVEVYGNLPN